MKPPRGKVLRAKDIMQRDIVTVREDSDVWAVARELIEHGITGAPVVNAQGDLVGVISQTDLVRYLRDQAPERFDFYTDPDPSLHESGPVVTAGNLMTREVMEASEDATTDDLARRMLLKRIHRILITRDRKIVGIVTTMDLLQAS